MKSSKKCPKCGGTEIYTDSGKTKRGDRASIGISNWSRLFVDTYICTGCGYLEEYVEMEDILNKSDKLSKNWGKL